MTPRAAYYIEILKTIGSPLISHALQYGLDDPKDNAQTVATHLSQSVQTGIDLSQLIDLGPMNEADDSVRVAMTGLAANLLALHGDKRVDTKSLKDSIQAVLSFADNFTPAALNTQRLQDLAAHGQIVDESQIHVQYVHAFLPVIEAVATFSFGQTTTKLMNDIASRLSIHADKIAKTVVDNDDDLEKQRVATGVLEALGQIYAACHKAQTDIITKNPNENASIDTVWDAFNTRLALLKTLVSSITDGQGEEDDINSGTDTIAPMQTINESQSPVNDTNNESPPETAPPPAPPSEPAAQSDDSASKPASNPMGAFVKKPKTDSAEAPSQERAPDQTPSEPDTPAQEQAQTEQPSTQSNPTPNDTPPTKENPMSFFKTPPPDE